MAVKSLLKQILDGVLIFHSVTERLSAVKTKSFSLNLCRGNDWAFPPTAKTKNQQTKSNIVSHSLFPIGAQAAFHDIKRHDYQVKTS